MSGKISQIFCWVRVTPGFLGNYSGVCSAQSTWKWFWRMLSQRGNDSGVCSVNVEMILACVLSTWKWFWRMLSQCGTDSSVCSVNVELILAYALVNKQGRNQARSGYTANEWSRVNCSWCHVVLSDQSGCWPARSLSCCRWTWPGAQSLTYTSTGRPTHLFTHCFL